MLVIAKLKVNHKENVYKRTIFHGESAWMVWAMREEIHRWDLHFWLNTQYPSCMQRYPKTIPFLLKSFPCSLWIPFHFWALQNRSIYLFIYLHYLSICLSSYVSINLWMHVCIYIYMYLCRGHFIHNKTGDFTYIYIYKFIHNIYIYIYITYRKQKQQSKKWNIKIKTYTYIYIHRLS